MENRKYKKGDIVKVWSLQSFYYGGFLKGKEGVVYQDQTGSSVLVSVERNFNGEYRIDPAYEVYSKQLELVKEFEDIADVNCKCCCCQKKEK